MEKKNEVSNYNSAQVGPLELQYSKTPKIRDLMGTEQGPEKLRQTLDYIYTLLNVKADNQLNEIEESVLNGFILTTYKNFTFEEIKHAYRLAASGSLEVEVFQKLDAVSFGKVLKAYKKHKAEQIKKHTQKQKTTEEPTEEQKAEILREFESLIDEYKEKRPKMTEPEITVLNAHIFKELYKRSELDLTEEEKNIFIEIATAMWPREEKNRKHEKNKFFSLDDLGRDDWIIQAASCLALYNKTRTPESAPE
jgi:hypothetical protein